MKRIDVLFATAEDIPAWMDLVALVADNFPGLEIDSYEETLKVNFDWFIEECDREGCGVLSKCTPQYIVTRVIKK